MTRRAVFLDRDGVLVETLVRGDHAYAPVSLAQFRVTEGAGPLVERLRGAGLLPIVFTNQPDVGRGLIPPAVLEEMHAQLRRAVAVEDVFVCVHDNGAGCDCRKPKPGMLQAAAAKWGIDLRRSFVIGDRWQDVDAGRAVGCCTILIARPYSGPAEPDARVADLAGAVDVVMRKVEDESVEFVKRYLDEVVRVAEAIDHQAVGRLVELLVDVRRRGGRLFILGVGGSAGNASHAVNDFRKIVGLEAYTPVDNVSELTARINDDGWDSSFANWLQGSRLTDRDCVLVFSVGGGDPERNVSVNLVRAMEYAKSVGARVCGVVGRTGGFTAKVADACVIVPTMSPDTVTPHTEAFQAVVWHLLVSHPRLQASPTKWESLDR
jgi:D-sedoheptulose 7-phosphate isomerase